MQTEKERLAEAQANYVSWELNNGIEDILVAAAKEVWKLNYKSKNILKCDPVIPMGDFPHPDSPGNWPEDVSWKDGNYWCRCIFCKEAFVGHKSRAVCKVCSSNERDYKSEFSDLEAVFDICYDADMRAIKRWQEATGRDRTWPDGADLTVWLLEQLDELEDELYGIRASF